MKNAFVFLILTACIVLSTDDVCAQAKQRVRFAAGTSVATVMGTVRGYAYKDHNVEASGGQTIDVNSRRQINLAC